MVAARDALFAVCERHQPVTVRQAFYLATVAGIVPKTEAGYKRIGRDLLEARRTGAIPYSWVADATRWYRKPQTYDCVEAALLHVANTYRKAVWADTGVQVEVWAEKDTVAGVLYEETARYDVPLMVCRGFPSETYVYESAEAIRQDGRPAFLYYVGDYDPSGVRIDANLEDKLRGFAPDAEIYFERLTVLPEQIRAWGLQTRPTKRGGNSHAKQFESEVSVEVEALDPARLRLIVREAIEQHIDPDHMRTLEVAEASERDIFRSLAKAVAGEDSQP